MRFDADHLRNKALLALEEVLQESRYRRPRRSIALRFAMAYLWSVSRGDRRHFDDFWRALGEGHPWSFSTADQALDWIYRGLGCRRDDDLSSRMWRRAQSEFSPRDANGMLLRQPSDES